MQRFQAKNYFLFLWILAVSICNVAVYSWIPEMVIPFSLIVGQISILFIASSKFSAPMKDVLLILTFIVLVGLPVVLLDIGCYAQIFRRCSSSEKQDLVVLTAYFGAIPFGFFMLFDRIPKIIKGKWRY